MEVKKGISSLVSQTPEKKTIDFFGFHKVTADREIKA